GSLGGSAAWTDVGSTAATDALTAIFAAAAAVKLDLCRMAWEFDNPGGLAPGNTPTFGTYSAADFIAGWQHTVTVARAAGYRGKFVYNPNGIRGDAATLNAYYPGDDYVDIVAIDAYAESGGWTQYDTGTPITWTQLLTFAKAHSKEIAVME